jgi:hypothetical protein
VTVVPSIEPPACAKSTPTTIVFGPQPVASDDPSIAAFRTKATPSRTSMTPPRNRLPTGSTTWIVCPPPSKVQPSGTVIADSVTQSLVSVRVLDERTSSKARGHGRGPIGVLNCIADVGRGVQNVPTEANTRNTTVVALRHRISRSMLTSSHTLFQCGTHRSRLGCHEPRCQTLRACLYDVHWEFGARPYPVRGTYGAFRKDRTGAKRGRAGRRWRPPRGGSPRRACQ